MNSWVGNIVLALAIFIGYKMLNDPYSHSKYLGELEQCVTAVEQTRNLGIPDALDRTAQTCAISYETWKIHTKLHLQTVEKYEKLIEQGRVNK